MSCFPELIYSIYADGELPEEEARQVKLHLATCPRCLALVNALRAENRVLSEMLQETEEVPIPALARPAWSGGIVWVAVFLLGAAAGLRAAFRLLQDYSPPAGAEWLNPFTTDFQWSVFFSGVFYFFQEGAAMLDLLSTTISAVLFGLLVLVGGLWLLRRRPATISALVMLLLAVGLATPAQALEVRRGRTVTLPAGQTVDDTLVAIGETVLIDGTVTGDLIATGSRIVVKGTVQGDAMLCGQTMDVEGTVAGNVYGFGQSLNLRGAVARNGYALTQTFQLHSAARVDQNLLALGKGLSVDGNVGRDVLGYAETADLRGNVGRDLRAYGRRVALLAPARVGGNLTAYVPRKQDLQVDSGATVAGKTETILRAARAPNYLRPGFYFWQAVRLVAALVTGLLFYWLFPSLFAVQLETGGAVLRTMGVGFLVLVATPVAAVLALITLIGLPIGLLALAAWGLGLYLAKILVAYALGQRLLRASEGQPRSMAHTLLVGLGIVIVAVNIPYLGGPIHFLLILLGLGAAFTEVRRAWPRAQVAG